tara:strand:- start:3870 stop:4106 length:237 start_codon:yes stop_codon:yes gene_type:complete
MPLYTLKNKKNEEFWEVECSWIELQETLKSDSDLVQGLSTPGFIGAKRDMIGQTPSGFKDHLNRIKAGSGRNNTIRTV